MSRFQAGALVVYGNLGVHEVEGVGLRHFCDEPAREYYTLRPYFSDSHDRSYIPTAKAGGAGGGVWGIAAGSRQASAGDFALKLHGYFLVRIFSSRMLSWSARSPTFIIWC